MRGSFDLRPDLQQWALLGVWSSEADFFRFYERSFISSWWKFFGCEKWTILCRPISSHGQWDGRNPFSSPSTEYLQEEPVAVLTRATIRWRRLGNFWSHVEEVSAEMAASEGYICSFGVGEAPLYRQATFSVWRSTAHMQSFAFGKKYHLNVIKKTREENWYREELFARFKPVATFGTLNGVDPLEGLIAKDKITNL